MVSISHLRLCIPNMNFCIGACFVRAPRFCPIAFLFFINENFYHLPITWKQYHKRKKTKVILTEYKAHKRVK